MPLILAINSKKNDGSKDVVIILGPDTIERMQEKDPVELNWSELPFSECRPNLIGISIATDAEMTQMTQLARQGKTGEAIKLAFSGWKYRPEMGDHDLPPERLG